MTRKQSWTGERLETDIYTSTTIEHLHRYALAKEFAKGKIVLDIACGEGYGSSLLSENALTVCGADHDGDVISKAEKKYIKPNLTFTKCSILEIPFANQTFDLIICFETLEHISNYTIAVNELKRVLKPDGLLILSTPDKKEYSDKTGYKNSFHLNEFYREELESLLQKSFKSTITLFQYSAEYSLISQRNTPSVFYMGDFNNIITSRTINHLFLIIFATDIGIPDVPNSFFGNNKILDLALEQKENEIKKSASYKIGHIFLLPFKILRNIFKKSEDG